VTVVAFLVSDAGGSCFFFSGIENSILVLVEHWFLCGFYPPVLWDN
jgi:hypothetical protein